MKKNSQVAVFEEKSDMSWVTILTIIFLGISVVFSIATIVLLILMVIDRLR